MTSRDWFSSMFIIVLIPCAVFRFIVFAPFGYYWAHTSTHWNVIKSHPELHNGTYPSIIATGEQIASNWGTFGFYWNFSVWIPTFWFPPPLNLPFTVIDTVTTIYLVRATHYQTSYVPHSKSSCAGAAYDWYRPPGANETFFQAAARLNGTVATPTKMCRTFVEEWQYGIVLSAFYATISLLNIVAFLGAIFGARRDGEPLLTFVANLLKIVLENMLNIPKGIVLLVVGILWFLPECIFRCLPLSIKSHVRFGRRYAIKTVLGAEQKAELGIMEMKTFYEQKKRQQMPRYQGGSGESSPFSDFLSIYDMLMVVAEELHYSDIMNLSRVSKSVREAVLPAGDLNRRLQTFRRYTCHGTQKADCWLCDKQICTNCQQLPLIPQATLSHHLHNCRPYCTSCYQHSVVNRRPMPSQRLHKPHCACAPTTAHPNFAMRWFNGSAYYANKQRNVPKFARAVCRECNLYTAEELLELREAKTKLELKRGETDGKKWTKCAKGSCGKDLGTGPRWWICGRAGCMKECRSAVHKGWGRSEKSKVVVGEEAV